MTQLPRLAARVFNRPLLVEPRFAGIVAQVIGPRAGLTVKLEGPAPQPAPAEHAPARSPMTTKSGIRIIPITGGLVHRGDAFDAECHGLISYTYAGNEIADALRDDKVRGILLDIDSPGGEAGGCFELSDMLVDARQIKPIYGIANTQACSAAYLILASCTKAFCTQSGDVGSIGVVCLHVDMSKAVEAAGLVTTFVYAGKHKVDGNPFEPLPASVKADLQDHVDLSYERFCTQVAARRPMSVKEIRKTEARVFSADAAKQLGLVDDVISLQAAIETLDGDLRARAPGPILKGASMTTTSPAPQAETFTAAQIEAARAEGHAAGVSAGRKMASTIILGEAAKGKERKAALYVGMLSMSEEDIGAALGHDKPESEAASGLLGKLMESHGPKSGAGDKQSDPDGRAARLAAVQASMKAASGARYAR